MIKRAGYSLTDFCEEEKDSPRYSRPTVCAKSVLRVDLEVVRKDLVVEDQMVSESKIITTEDILSLIFQDIQLQQSSDTNKS